jgi:hypothetical protein
MMKWLEPKTDDPLRRKQGRLVIATSLALAGAVLALVLFWIFSGSLEDIETPFIGLGFMLVMVGLAALARSGRVRLAGWLLTGLMLLLIGADVADYGLGSPTAAAFVIPIVLAGLALGLWPGLGAAILAALVVWLVDWLDPARAANASLVTFNAPALTLIFLIVAVMVGWWGRAVEGGGSRVEQGSGGSRVEGGGTERGTKEREER